MVFMIFGNASKYLIKLVFAFSMKLNYYLNIIYRYINTDVIRIMILYTNKKKFCYKKKVKIV